MPSVAFCAVYRYRYTMPICAALYGLVMRSDMHGQNKAAPNYSGAVNIIPKNQIRCARFRGFRDPA